LQIGVATCRVYGGVLGRQTAAGTENNTSADVGFVTNPARVNIALLGTDLRSTTETVNATNMCGEGWLALCDKDATPGNTTITRLFGTIAIDAAPPVAPPNGGTTWKMTPSNALRKLESVPIRVAVRLGTVTLAVKFYKTAAGGNAPRFIVRRDDNLGIAADQVASMPNTASAWQTLTLTFTTTKAGEVEMVFDCDSSVGGGTLRFCNVEVLAGRMQRTTDLSTQGLEGGPAVDMHSVAVGA
jgi:hypothetical protein